MLLLRSDAACSPARYPKKNVGIPESQGRCKETGGDLCLPILGSDGRVAPSAIGGKSR